MRPRRRLTVVAVAVMVDRARARRLWAASFSSREAFLEHLCDALYTPGPLVRWLDAA